MGTPWAAAQGQGQGTFHPAQLETFLDDRKEEKSELLRSHRMHKHPLFQFHWLRWMTCICHSGSIFSHAFSFSDSQSCTTNPYQFYTLESNIYIIYIFMSTHSCIYTCIHVYVCVYACIYRYTTLHYFEYPQGSEISNIVSFTLPSALLLSSVFHLLHSFID